MYEFEVNYKFEMSEIAFYHDADNDIELMAIMANQVKLIDGFFGMLVAITVTLKKQLPTDMKFPIATMRI